jgi:hypothetical protein
VGAKYVLQELNCPVKIGRSIKQVDILVREVGFRGDSEELARKVGKMKEGQNT